MMDEIALQSRLDAAAVEQDLLLKINNVSRILLKLAVRVDSKMDACILIAGPHPAEVGAENAERAAEISAENAERAAEISAEIAERAAKVGAEIAERAAEVSAENAERAAEVSAENAERAAEVSAENAERAAEVSAENAERAAEVSAENAERAAEVHNALEMGGKLAIHLERLSAMIKQLSAIGRILREARSIERYSDAVYLAHEGFYVAGELYRQIANDFAVNEYPRGRYDEFHGLTKFSGFDVIGSSWWFAWRVQQNRSSANQ